MQSLPLTRWNISSQRCFSGRLEGQKQPKIGDWRSCCHELWHLALNNKSLLHYTIMFIFFILLFHCYSTYTSVMTHWSRLRGQLALNVCTEEGEMERWSSCTVRKGFNDNIYLILTNTIWITSGNAKQLDHFLFLHTSVISRVATSSFILLYLKLKSLFRSRIVCMLFFVQNMKILQNVCFTW